MGAGGRDFHDFNTVFRDDPGTGVVAVHRRADPRASTTGPIRPSLAGPRYPDGIPIVPEDRLAALVRREGVDEVVLAYSDLSHVDVMHKASVALAAGADFRLLGPGRRCCAAACRCSRCARSGPAAARARPAAGSANSCWTPGCGSRWSAIRCRTATSTRCGCSGSRPSPTSTPRTRPSRSARSTRRRSARAWSMYAGVDYAAILRPRRGRGGRRRLGRRQQRLPVLRARPDGHRRRPAAARPRAGYHPGETKLRMADVVVVNKVDSADPDASRRRARRPRGGAAAVVVRTASPVALERAGDGPDGDAGRPGRRPAGPRRRGRPDDHPRRHAVRRRHGRRPARRRRRVRRPAAVRGRLDRRDLRAVPGHRSGAAGDGLRRRAAGRTRRHGPGRPGRRCVDVVVVGTPMDLGRLVDLGPAVRRATYGSATPASPRWTTSSPRGSRSGSPGRAPAKRRDAISRGAGRPCTVGDRRPACRAVQPAPIAQSAERLHGKEKV